MHSLVRRRSKLARPPWRVAEALVSERAAWWVSVAGEVEPEIAVLDDAHLAGSSPLRNRPDDRLALYLTPEDGGTLLVTEHAGATPFFDVEAVTIKFRWSEHVDRDLSDWLDTASPVRRYSVTEYRVDVDDWGVIAQLAADQLWTVNEPVSAVVSHLGPELRLGAEMTVPAGAELRLVAVTRRRTSATFVIAAPASLEAALRRQPCCVTRAGDDLGLQIAAADIARCMSLRAAA